MGGRGTRGLTSPFTYLTISEYEAVALKMLKSLNLRVTVDRISETTYHLMRADWKFDARKGVELSWWRKFIVEQALLKNKKIKNRGRFVELPEIMDPKSGNDISRLIYEDLIEKINNRLYRRCVDDWIHGISGQNTAEDLSVTRQTVMTYRRKGIEQLRSNAHVFS